MRKSGWAATAGFGSLAMLLTACGGSSSSSAVSGSTPTTTAAGAAAQPSSALGITPGTTVLIVQKSALGFVLARTNGQVVYVYDKDSKGGSPTCTGSCASTWTAVLGKPAASPADTLPGTLGTVSTANGAKQITYNGLPLYSYKGAKVFATTGNGGDWHVIKLSSSDIKSG
jgi:predicted lipoprotein with Yx(FWY)xxD motif